MKLLINGYTVSEHLELKVDKKNLELATKIIEHIKKNGNLYFYTIYITALLLNLDIIFYPHDLVHSFCRVGRQLLDILLYFAKWEFLCRGIQGIISVIFSRGNIINAACKNLKFFIGFLFIEFYPRLMEVLKTLKL